jgi:hypothetical protein
MHLVDHPAQDVRNVNRLPFDDHCDARLANAPAADIRLFQMATVLNDQIQIGTFFSRAVNISVNIRKNEDCQMI